MEYLHSTIAQPEACLQSPAEDFYDELTALEASDTAECAGGERPVAPVATPVLWGEASGSDGPSCELGFGFGDCASRQACTSLDSGSPFPCMASILEKQIAEAEQLFPGAEEAAPLGSGMHVSRSCTDLKAALAAPFAGMLSPATPLPADVLAAKPHPSEPAVSASCLDAADETRRAGATAGTASVRLGLAFNGAAAVRDRCGPLLSCGSWRGCIRSAWCHRDSRHLGACTVHLAASGVSAGSLSDTPLPPAAAAFITIGCEGEAKGPARLGSPQPLHPDSDQGSAADTGSLLAAHVAAAAAAPAECESGNEEVEGGGIGKVSSVRALHSTSLDSRQSSGSGSASVQRHCGSGTWVSAGDPEATDLSGASAKSGASADSDDDDGAARSPLRPLPARALPPLAALEHADALLNARPEP
ncbi:hypothetical protein WJX81_005818, partial [Elliptochloris bilobata]